MHGLSNPAPDADAAVAAVAAPPTLGAGSTGNARAFFWDRVVGSWLRADDAAGAGTGVVVGADRFLLAPP